LSSALARPMGFLFPVLSQIFAELNCSLKCCFHPFAENFMNPMVSFPGPERYSRSDTQVNSRPPIFFRWDKKPPSRVVSLFAVSTPAAQKLKLQIPGLLRFFYHHPYRRSRTIVQTYLRGGAWLVYSRPTTAALVFLAGTARARIVPPNLGSAAPGFAGGRSCQSLPMWLKVSVGTHYPGGHLHDDLFPLFR
jgi:hypothetical protein